MIPALSHASPHLSFNPNCASSNPSTTSRLTKVSTLNTVRVRSQSLPSNDESKESNKSVESRSLLCCSRYCCCGRRRFIETVGAACLPNNRSDASDLPPEDPAAVMNRIHPPRADWYEEFYAYVLDKFTRPYEDEIAGYKSQLFDYLRGKASKILEIGVGTGPNIKYYAAGTDVNVFGIDPNRKMEKYAQAAAVTAGLPPTNFKFMHAVAEALPLSDGSVDAVVGTLVLCSVKDVDLALREVRRVLKPGGLYIFVEHVAARDGSFLRVVQSVLNPLQQAVSDGCHLTRKTEKNIYEAGFSSVDLNMAFLSTASLVNPHAYGIARN